MCGIFGIISTKSIVGVDVDRLRGKLTHRGPDASDIVRLTNNVTFGHVRLSILDLSDAGVQPMTSHCGRYTITFNGEVYNFKCLAKKYGLNNLKSSSDTEVILELFSKIGVKAIPLLNGMFAFAIRDNDTKITVLVRDRLGIKPLYYVTNKTSLSFASEIKSLAEPVEGMLSQLEKNKLHEWLYYGNTLGEKTLLKNVINLTPGSYISVDEQTLMLKHQIYWSPKEPASYTKKDIPALIEENKKLLEQAVKRQLVSDVPIGVFLSGGIDSSAITAFASKHYKGKLKTYSVGFDFDKGVNELAKAKLLANKFGTEHSEMHISGIEVADIVEKMICHHDQPFSDAANIPLYLLCDKVKNTTKVVLQGDGGDEMYGGYKRYHTLGNLPNMKLKACLGDIVNQLMPRNKGYYVRQRYINALKSKDNAKLMALLLTVEDEKQQPSRVFGCEVKAEIEKVSPFQRYYTLQEQYKHLPLNDQMALIDSQIILPDIFLEKVDRSTMASSVEVRVPFLDNDLVEFAQSIPSSLKIPGGHQKWLLKQSLHGIVPDDVLYGKKTGFGVPFGFWVSSALKELLFDNLEQVNIKQPNFFDIDYILKLHQEHITNARDSGFMLWKLMNLAIWINKQGIALK
jgi:asparagine synthase (glutamine-hydrolysing)